MTNLNDCLDGYGSTFIINENTKISSYSLDEIKNEFNLNFNVLIADCEGFLEVFFDENPTFYDNLRLFIFEADYPEKCNYNKIKNKLVEKKFVNLLNGHQNVWVKFDWQYYLDTYLDLRQNGILTEDQSIWHWNSHGRKEGREPFGKNE